MKAKENISIIEETAGGVKLNGENRRIGGD
jgi:hypothetical protein